MNREILFRGFHKDESDTQSGTQTIYLNGEEIKGEWVEGFYWTNGLGNHFIRVIKKEEDSFSKFTIENFEIIPETVGQYTGLDDKNGKKIFENDVVYEGCNGLIESVIYDNKIGTYKLKDLGDYYIKDAPIEWEVIGNIFDLKGEDYDS